MHLARSVFVASCLLGLALADSAVAQTPADEARARAQYEQGLRELYAGNPEAALEAAEAAQSLLGSDNPRLAAMRVEAHMAMRDWDAAQESYQAFFALNPNGELSRHVANLTVIIDQAIEDPDSVPPVLGLEPGDAMAGKPQATERVPAPPPTGPQSLALDAGFSPAPARLQVVSGGTARLRQVVSRRCPGWADTEPDLVFDYAGATGDGQLFVYIAEASGDMTLAVQEPNGDVSCNDDQSGVAPGVRLRNASAGQYRVWVGSYHGNRNNATRHTGTLLISETGFDR